MKRRCWGWERKVQEWKCRRLGGWRGTERRKKTFQPGSSDDEAALCSGGSRLDERHVGRGGGCVQGPGTAGEGLGAWRRGREGRGGQQGFSVAVSLEFSTVMCCNEAPSTHARTRSPDACDLIVFVRVYSEASASGGRRCRGRARSTDQDPSRAAGQIVQKAPFFNMLQMCK